MSRRRTRLYEAVEADIKGILGYLMELGLVDDSRFKFKTSQRSGKFTLESNYWASAPKVLSGQGYEAFYSDTFEAGAFDLRMLDGALIQLQYEFSNPYTLSKSVQRFLPAPDLLPYVTDPDLYFGDELYGDIVGLQATSVPIRFDYDPRPEVVKEHVHSASHLTLGQYANCRIPVVGPVAPRDFFEFVLTAFYQVGDSVHARQLPSRSVPLTSRSLSAGEEGCLYLSHAGAEATEGSSCLR